MQHMLGNQQIDVYNTSLFDMLRQLVQSVHFDRPLEVEVYCVVEGKHKTRLFTEK